MHRHSTDIHGLQKILKTMTSSKNPDRFDHYVGTMVVKELTPCLWHGHQLHGGADIQQQPLDCNQLQSGEEWSGGPPGPGSLHSGGCKVAATHRDNMIISDSTGWYNNRFTGQLKWAFTVICKPLLVASM